MKLKPERLERDSNPWKDSQSSLHYPLMFFSFDLSCVMTACEYSSRNGIIAACYAMARVGVDTWELQVHLPPTPLNFSSFFSLKQIYLLCEILPWKNVWIWLNPRFSVLRRNLENNTKNVAILFHRQTFNRRMGPEAIYMSFLQDGVIRVRNVCRNDFQKSYRLLQKYPRFIER